MQINGARQQQRGHVLLIAGDVAVRRRTVQVIPSANLAALSLVPVRVLLDSNVPSDTTYLDGIHDQNALQVRLRAAAATPGPLVVYLSGRLTTDRRGQQLYLALPRTTTATARYTALPWEWLGTELRNRPAALTTVVVDVAADKGAWPLVQEYGSLPPAASAEVYGVITPPGFSGSDGVSTYTRHWIEQLRCNPARPTNARLHALTVSAAALPPGTLVIPTTPEITAPTYDAESAARLPMANVRRLLAGDTGFLSGRRQPAEPREAAPGLDCLPSAPVPVQAVRPVPAPQPQPPAGQMAPPVPGQEAYGRDVLPGHQQSEGHTQHPVRAPHPGTTAAPQQPAPAPQQFAPYVAPPVPAPVPEQDPRPYIAAAAEAGRYREAADMAIAWEQHTLQQYGASSPQATQWTEIRADLAKRAGNFVLSTQLWVAAARTRLAHQTPDAPELLSAAGSAHYCWTQIKDAAGARACGPELVSLLRALPALDRRHLSMAQQRLEYLNNMPSRT